MKHSTEEYSKLLEGRLPTSTLEFELCDRLIELQELVKNCSIPDVRLSCYKEVFEKFQEIDHESEFYGWLHAKAHEA